MTTFGNKRTLIALSVTAAITSTAANAATFKQYNYSDAKPIKAQASIKNDEKELKQASAWLVKLNTPSIAQSKSLNSNIASQTASIMTSQALVESAIQTMDLNINIVAKTSKLVNALLVKGDKREIEQLVAHNEVAGIFPIYDSELHIADSAEYIKAAQLVASDVANGSGVKVAVLDTGIDYTHAAFGGEGTEAAYVAAAEDPMDAVAWPQGQVHGGYDFFAIDDDDPTTFPDPDPIDVGTSHGTHVAHSVSGIAPNVELYAYAVCRGGCPGLAQLLALEAAMDPNGDGDISDRVDVINMSLGGDFGDIATDGVGLAINQAVKLGTSVVISAGNDGAYPFIVGGPSTSENALSVGAMTHPTDETLIPSLSINGEDAIIQLPSFGPSGAYTYSNTDLEVVYPDVNQTACEPFADGTDFTGKAVVLDRGDCSFTSKVLMAQAKGAELVFIANSNDDGTPAPMGGASTEVTIPSVGITYQAGIALKESGVFSVNVDAITTAGAIASFSSRGPSMDGLLKPEITAPGVNIMTAHPGTGTGLSGATGTSFSGPMTAGAMSLLKQAHPNRNAVELKATIMNTANLDVTMEPRSLNPETELAPISYIGAGLVDVEKAANLPVAAWAKDTKQAALSLGLINPSQATDYVKTVQVKNFTSESKTYDLSLEQRFSNDIERGALMVMHPDSITVPGGQTISFDVTFKIDPAKLPEWTLNQDNIGTREATADLTNLELDGALIFSEGGEKALHLVYHTLPKAASELSFEPVKIEGTTAHKVTNVGAVAFEPFFAPTTVSDADEGKRLDLVSGSLEMVEVPTEFCESGYSVLSTLVMSKGVSHSYIGGFMVDFDLDQDGTYDVTAQNGKLEWFYDVEPRQISFTHAYGDTRGTLGNMYHTTGNNFMTIQSCLGAFGLTTEQIGLPANVRFRIEEGTWTPIAYESLDSVVGTFRFAPSASVASLMTADGNYLEKLEVGDSGYIVPTGKGNRDFVILSESGSKPVNFQATTAPMLADTEFEIVEKSENGTVVGVLEVTYGAEHTNLMSEFIVVNQTSTAVKLEQSGEIVVADESVLDYGAGLTEIEMEVVVTDTAGNISEPAMVKITVKEINTDPLPEPVTPPKTKKSSGSFGWLALLAAPLAFIRRRKVK